MTKWLVAVDESSYANSAFNFAVQMMDPDQDLLYLMHIGEDHTLAYVGVYTTSQLIEDFRSAAELRSRKILVHYGRKARKARVDFRMITGVGNNPGEILCQAVQKYKIDNLVMGRRSIGSVERFFVGSTSMYCFANCPCCVTVIKAPFGAAEEHGSKVEVIAAEEHERIRRMEPAEIHDKVDVVAVETAERKIRIEEQTNLDSITLHKLFTHFQFHDDILKLNKDKDEE